ncbi:MAG: hypothetical protein ACI4PT_07710 [Candidatus Avoscillospira sp.]
MIRTKAFTFLLLVLVCGRRIPILYRPQDARVSHYLYHTFRGPSRIRRGPPACFFFHMKYFRSARIHAAAACGIFFPVSMESLLHCRGLIITAACLEFASELFAKYECFLRKQASHAAERAGISGQHKNDGRDLFVLIFLKTSDSIYWHYPSEGSKYRSNAQRKEALHEKDPRECRNARPDGFPVV